MPRSARRFRSPETWLEGLDPDSAAALLAATSDIALVIDDEGVIRDVAVSAEELDGLDPEPWFGRPWAEVVAPDSRRKTEMMRSEAKAGVRSRWREINHLAVDGASVPISFAATRVSGGGYTLVVGRDLATISRLQQRVVDIQRTMEADYARLRNAETRYRLLFQMAQEAVFVIDASTGRIAEANPAAAKFVGTAPSRLVERPFRDLFAAESQIDLQAALMSARTIGRAQEARLRLSGQAVDAQLSASHFRHDSAQYLLVRLAAADRPDGMGANPSLEIFKRFPEAFAAVDADGRILDANLAFLDLAELPSLEAARGASIDRWLGRPGIDFGLIASNLRDHGSIRDFGTSLRGELGSVDDVDVTAVYVPSEEEPCIGMVIRAVRHRSALPMMREAGLAPTVENLTHLVGTMPLKELVRETTDMIEQMCIEAALKLTDDNRASAAQILGLSRQSLYAKLHRFGIGDLPTDATN